MALSQMISRRVGQTLSKGMVVRLRNAAIVLVGISLPVLIGFIGPKDKKFDFASAAIVATAIATLALAYLTATLASVTREDASGTRRIADATERDLKERNAGTIVVMRFDYDAASSTAQVYLKNVGLGPAVYINTVVELRAAEHKSLMSGTSANDYALASEEETDVRIRLVPSPDLTEKTLVEEVLTYGTFLGRGNDPRHFMWRRDEQGRVFALWGDHATAELMEGIVRRPNWATLQP